MAAPKKNNNIVKTPTTASLQLKTTSTAVGFDTNMTVHTPPPHRSSTPFLDSLLSRLNQPNLDNHLRLS